MIDDPKQAARYAVREALRKGELSREPCEVCGAADVEAHHDDYAKPLDVRWLCRRHHTDHHLAHPAFEQAHGRPPKDKSEATLTKRATILFTPDDWLWLERQAAINRQSVAAYIREMVSTARMDD